MNKRGGEFDAACRRGLMAVALILSALSAPRAAETALDRYIAKPDPSYGWELVRTIDGDGYTAYVLDLTSQTWRSENEVDRPVWKHWLTIVKPDGARFNTALLYIDGGNNLREAPTEVSPRSLRLAVETGSVVADLGMVPNQPLFFADSKRHGRSEDDLIAYSRVKYIITGDEEWLARLPMVKSGVRAMDAMTEFLAGDAGGGINVERFVVSGGSKRAWTTWLVGVVDPRVVAIIPLVIDALNIEAVTRHHFAAYGFFSPSLGDYVRHGLYPQKLGSKEFDAILEIEDPYQYRGRPSMKLPKYLINASGDQYFLPDNSQLYFSDLPEEKYLRYVPNAKHNLAGSDSRESMISFYQSVLNDWPRPKFSWELKKDGSIAVTAADRPREVNLWQAVNPEARDFRLDTIGPAWKSSPLKESGSGRYHAKVKEPAKGFTAFFVEMVYESGGKYPYKFTTDVSILPDVLPFASAKMEPILGPRN